MSHLHTGEKSIKSGLIDLCGSMYWGNSTGPKIDPSGPTVVREWKRRKIINYDREVPIDE